MKTFRSFVNEGLTGVAPKAKGEHKFVHSTYMAQTKDPGDLEKVGPEEVGPHDTKLGQGKRKADRLDNKQKFGESIGLEKDMSEALTALKPGRYGGMDVIHTATGKRIGGVAGPKGPNDIYVGIHGSGQSSDQQKEFKSQSAAHEWVRDRQAKQTKGTRQLVKATSTKVDEELESPELSEEVPMAARALYAQTYAKHGKTASKSSEAKQKAYDAVEKKHGSKVLAQLKAHHQSNEEFELEEVKSAEKPKMQTSDPGYVNINGARVKDTPEDRLKHHQKTFPNAKSLPKNEEADFSKSQTTMAHAIGKHFKKKGIGDESKGGPYAVASAMVRDKPDAAKKAYATIKAKMKNEDHQDALMSLYDDLSENNQDTFMSMLEVDADKLLEFALKRIE